MIGIVYENVIIWTTIHNFPTTPCESRFVSKDCSKKVVDSNIVPNIILPQKMHQLRKVYFQDFTIRVWSKEKKRTFGTP